MKKLLKEINRGARRTLITGGALIAAVLAASVFLYLGAGRLFDYYGAMDISEKLLFRPCLMIFTRSSKSCLQASDRSALPCVRVLWALSIHRGAEATPITELYHNAY